MEELQTKVSHVSTISPLFLLLVCIFIFICIVIYINRHRVSDNEKSDTNKISDTDGTFDTNEKTNRAVKDETPEPQE